MGRELELWENSRDHPIAPPKLLHLILTLNKRIHRNRRLLRLTQITHFLGSA
jgi:hypothetical protein